MDLASLNIQRGRDHGIAPYNIWREQCGLRRFRRFEEMTDVMAARTVRSLSRVYDDVDDVDLFTGGLSERPVVGGLVGPTFACIIGQQFLNLRRGDRFWYENPGVFTSDQLQEIRKTSLARAICDNLDDIEVLQPYAFLMIDDYSNRRISCKSRFIPRLDLNLWRERPAPRTDPNEGVDLGHELRLRPVVRPPLSPLAPFYSHTMEVPVRLKGDDDDRANELDPASRFNPHGPVLGGGPNTPYFRESIPFTAEVPRPISREQYYSFFDTLTEELWGSSGDGSSSDYRSSSSSGGKGGDSMEAREASSMSPLDDGFVKALFTSLLKTPGVDDDDADFRPRTFL